jgi:hypothetical protein
VSCSSRWEVDGEGEDGGFEDAVIEERVALRDPPDELELFGRGGTAYAV